MRLLKRLPHYAALLLALGSVTCTLAQAQLAAQKGPEITDMNRSVDPCTDFYEFANGAWRAANPIPASMQRWSRRWQAGESNKDHLKLIAEGDAALTNQPAGSVPQLVGDFYASCMDEKSANRLGIKPVQPYFKKIDAIASRVDLERVILDLHNQAEFVPFAIVSGQDNHQPTEVIAQFYSGGLGMPDRDYYLKPEERFADARVKYVEHVQKMFELAGRSPEEAKKMAATVMTMETAMAKATLDNVELRDPSATDHKVKFSDLGQMAPHFDWAAYFKGAQISTADLNVDQPKFLAEFDRQYFNLPLADWKIYLKWHVLNSAAGALSAPFVEEDYRFNSAYLAGTKEIKPRWKRCVEQEDQLLGEAFGQEYVKRYFPPEAKARVQEMVKNILAAMGDTIQGLDWMGPETKQKALLKLSTFNPKIGYPDKWRDYSSVHIERGAYFANLVEGRRFFVADDRAHIGKPVDRQRWGMTPPTSDAYYNPQLNEIVFPAGILQPPAFSMAANDAVNYGSIGVVIGHEISHGFDDQGAQYAADGSLSNWWTADDQKKFQAKTACVSNQFDGYFIEPTIHHNGKLVLGESIGDLGGAKLAYLAFQKSQQGKPPLPVIDGFTPEQQFFIAWGQFRGDNIRPETQRLMIQGDPHPIAKFRVIGPLSNLPAFQKAFNCAPGSAMVRPAEKRCEVW